MKYGIFGGAFDPPHVEHIEMARRACAELGLDRLYVVVTYIPPHKSGATADFKHRLEMARIAFKDNPKVIVTDIEEHLSDSYSTTVVAAIKECAPDAEWYFVMGGDSVEKMLTWHQPERLSSMVKFALIKRGGYATFDDSLRALERTIDLDYVIMDYVGEEVSSSVVQGELELYRASNSLTPSVVEYIKGNNLYARYTDLVDRVRGALTPKTYAHVCRTALTALSYRSSLKLPFDKVFVAALLHDIAKDSKDSYSSDASPVKHQFEGRAVAQRDYGIEDEDILKAIETHTTGEPDMSPLQKLVYLADMLEPARDFPAVDMLRQAVKEDFDGGFCLAVEHTLQYLRSTGATIHPLTEACLEFYKK